MLYFVENLNRRVWFSHVLPQIEREAPRSGPLTVRYFDASPQGLGAAQKSVIRLPDVSLERLLFRLIDVRDESGVLVRLQVHFSELGNAGSDLEASDDFRKAFARPDESRLRSFVLKEALKFSILGRTSLSRGLVLIAICAWSMRRENRTSAVLFTEARPWFSILERHAAKAGIRLIPVHTPRTLPGSPGELYSSLQQQFPRLFFVLQSLRNLPYALPVSGRGAVKSDAGAPRIQVASTGYFNVDRPECYADLFFWHSSNLPGSSVLLTFALPVEPIDEERLSALARHGIKALALQPGTTQSRRAPLFTYRPRFSVIGGDGNRLAVGGGEKTLEGDWLGRQASLYALHRDYWTQLFLKENVKLFASWYRYDGTHCATGDAIKAVGGIGAIYQRALQVDSTPDTRIDVDVAFGFSPFDAGVEKGSGSVVRYHVSTGYLGDHRFPLLKPQAEQLRLKLRERGAQFIVAFFDEFAGKDERWNTGETLQRDNYAFLFERLLGMPELGLILKPKVPGSLKKRLGPVADLLDKALATGRCYCFEEGAIQGIYPPAGAAMAADVAIHGHACTGTAGFEAALAGTPTVMLDIEGFHTSAIYELGPQVIFRSRQELWEAVMEYRKAPAAHSALGRWSPMIEKLDPFRDGRGAFRMGEYLRWLLEDLREGAGREQTMARAAEKYAGLYGHDKVAEINVR